MNSPISAVLERISTIERRFAPTPPDAPGTGGDFSAALGAAEMAAGLADPAGTTGIGTAASSDRWTTPRLPGRATPLDPFAGWGAAGGTGWNANLAGGGAEPTGWGSVGGVPGAEAGGWANAASPGSVAGMSGLDGRPVAAGTPFASLFDAAGARHGVPPRLLAAIGWVESRYDPGVVSPAGAQGMMQLMPFVAEHYGVDAFDPAQAVDAAARLLAEHHDRFGSWELATASYFSGAGAVSRAGNRPPTDRSHDYVRKVDERISTT